MSSMVVHYGELALKGRNRGRFLTTLEQNIRSRLETLGGGKVQRLAGRLLVHNEGAIRPLSAEVNSADSPPGAAHTDGFPADAVQAVASVYGVASAAAAVSCPLDLETMRDCALSLLEGRTYESFRVTARRAVKELPLTSLEVNQKLGALIWKARPARVKMVGADVEVYVEMLAHQVLIYVDRVRGAGGLPVGVSGKLVVLLSGGIDSPVAAARMQKRGAALAFVHFHSVPFHDRTSQEKARELVSMLARAQRGATLVLVPFGALQRQIVLQAPESLRVILYRRFMVRIASEIAARLDALALVTGDSLGQVASQTLPNLKAVEAASPLPVFRPLIGMDKQEIVDQAKALGTYDISIIPDQDCCQLFTPARPETQARLSSVERAEARMDVAELCGTALRDIEVVHYGAPWREAKRLVGKVDA